MRIGLWGAAALALVACAGQADAATWLRYSFQGAGFTVKTDAIGNATAAPVYHDYRVTFSVLIEPASVSDGSGNLYVSDGKVFTASGPSLLTFTVNGAQSGSLSANDSYAISGAGGSRNLSVSYADPDGIGGLPTTLGFLAVTGGFSMRSADYFNNSGNTLGVTVSSFSISATNGFEALAIDAVPEPATWAMMIVGAGAIGLTARRRRYSAALA